MRPEETPAAAQVWLSARKAAAPAIPLPVHDDAEVLAHFVDRVAPVADVHVAVEGDRLVGVLAVHDGWLEHLYLLPSHTGAGIGRRLVQRAKELSPAGLQLWVFETNGAAQRFYSRHGFVPVERTDGSGNMERAPDVRMAWPSSATPEPWDVVAVNLAPDADNRIHDDDVAQSFGFAGALVPGVEVFALATTPLVQTWGEAFLASGRLSLRFRKPVYDGERVTVAVDGDAVSVTGPDGVLRASGLVSPSAEPAPPEAYDDAPLPPRPEAQLRLGAFGTVRVPAAPQECADYVRGIGDPLPVYRDVVHPGLLLRLVNLALMSNVELGPWIHTASDARFLGLARVDEDVEVRSRVTDLFERKGHAYVRYDALVLAAGRPVVEVNHEAIWRLAGQGA